jgi:hypothetical protein
MSSGAGYRCPNPVRPPTFTKASLTLLNGLNPSVPEFMLDATRMIANMVATGAKKRSSNIKIISSHGGGTIPFLVNRLQMHYRAGTGFGFTPVCLYILGPALRLSMPVFLPD